MSPNHCLTLSYFDTGPEGYILSSPEAEGSRAHLLFLGLSIVISEASGSLSGRAVMNDPFFFPRLSLKAHTTGVQWGVA